MWLIVVEVVINQVVVILLRCWSIRWVSCCCPDVPVEHLTLTLLTTIAGDGCLFHLVEEIVNDELQYVDVLLLFAVVAGVVVAFNFPDVILLFQLRLLNIVVIVVLDEPVLLNVAVNVVDDVLVDSGSDVAAQSS